MPDRAVICCYYCFKNKASHLTKALESCCGSYCAGLKMSAHGVMPAAPVGFWGANITWTVQSAEWVSPGWLEAGHDLFPSFCWWNPMKENSGIQILATGLNLYKCTLLFFFSFPVPSMEFPQTVKFESRFDSTKSLCMITFEVWWGTQFKTL